VKILVADDSRVMRQIVIRTLRQAGYDDHDIVEAEDGRDALDKVAARLPRLVLLDMRMPVMDGWDFARALREAGISAPVVVMTAAADARRWAAEIGAIGVVPKPFGVAELIGAVDRYSA
jgi:two-component system chemotaxis response regulator CheY